MQLDPSFKQYAFSSQPDIAAVLGFDKAAYQQAFLQSAVIDTNGNRLSGGNTQELASQLENYQHQGIDWAKSIGFAQAMARLQRQNVVRKSSPSFFLGTLPYKVVVQANTFQTIPANLRWTVTVDYFASDMDVAYDNPVFEKTIPLPQIGSQKLALSFMPATDTDAETLHTLQSQGDSSYLPICSMEFLGCRLIPLFLLPEQQCNLGHHKLLPSQ